GELWEIDDPGGARYRCHTGHAYTARALLSEQGQATEMALWSAVRALRENASAARLLERRARTNGDAPAADRYAARADVADEHADVLARILASTTPDAA